MVFDRLGYCQHDLWQHLNSYIGMPCELCGVVLSQENAEIDHIKQLAHAETEDDVWALNVLENLRVVCGDCNRHRPTRG